MSSAGPCRGRNKKGGPCRSPIVDADGWCTAHKPGGNVEMQRRGLKGAIASRKGREGTGLSPDALGPLRTHEDAKRWLEAIGRAVVTGKLQDRAAQAGIRAVEAWTKTEGERLTVEVVGELRQEVDRLKKEMHGGPSLKVTP